MGPREVDVSPETVDGYRHAAHALHGFWDWYLLQLDTWGIAVALTVQASVLLATWCLIGATCHLVGRLREKTQTRRSLRRLEQYANHPASRAVLDDFHQPRKETP
jgi:hypothetical protein